MGNPGLADSEIWDLAVMKSTGTKISPAAMKRMALTRDFDFTDKSSIALVVELAQALPSGRGKLSRLSSPPFDPAPVFDRVCRHLSDIYILDM